MTAPGKLPKVIAKRILDEKMGLAIGQPEFKVVDSLLLFPQKVLDEHNETQPRNH